jgi:hypothetical protein
MKKRIVFIAIIVILVVTSGVGYYQYNKKLDILQVEMDTARENIRAQNSEIDNLSVENLDLQDRIKGLNEQINNKNKQISELNDNNTLAENKLNQYKNSISNTRLQLESANRDLKQALVKIRLTSETLGEVDSGILPEGLIDNAKYIIPRRTFNLKRNKDAVNPTWQELEDFLKTDQTDEKLYISDEYTCGNFAEDIFNNAEEKGIKAAIVLLTFDNQTAGHAINAFKTTDYGLVYIDCTGASGRSDIPLDSEVDLKIGQQYQRDLLFSSRYYFEPLGVVKTIRIYW